MLCNDLLQGNRLAVVHFVLCLFHPGALAPEAGSSLSVYPGGGQLALRLPRRRAALSASTPKGLHLAAQGQRSATLGEQSPPGFVYPEGVASTVCLLRSWTPVRESSFEEPNPVGLVGSSVSGPDPRVLAPGYPPRPASRRTERIISPHSLPACLQYFASLSARVSGGAGAVVRNHSSVPHCGHGASPGGRDGSRRTNARQSGQRFGLPSGVRDEIVITTLLGGRPDSLSNRTQTKVRLTQGSGLFCRPGHALPMTRPAGELSTLRSRVICAGLSLHPASRLAVSHGPEADDVVLARPDEHLSGSVTSGHALRTATHASTPVQLPVQTATLVTPGMQRLQ